MVCGLIKINFFSGSILKKYFCKFAPRVIVQPSKNKRAKATESQIE
jgi:hypothetical protein